MQFFHGTNIDFLKYRKAFFTASNTINIIGLILIFIVPLFGYPMIEYGIEFLGGTEIGVKFSKNIEADKLRADITNLGLSGDEIKSFGKENQFLIRIKETGDEVKDVQAQMLDKFKDYGIEIIKVETIGPKIGDEMRNWALVAVILAVLAILVYIAFRFELIFGLGAVFALVHDVVFTFSLIVIINKLGLMNLEFNANMLAAMLTVIGFSINDTVIIFDRIRENKERQKGMNFFKLVNLSINETLSRTINTVATVVLVLMIMVLFAGPVLEGFAFTMLIGILIGTYSSIYIASNFVIWYLHKFRGLKEEHTVEEHDKLSAAKA